MLVVSRRGRRPRDEDEFSPVSIGVGGEERDLLALHGTLCDRDKVIETIGRHVWPLATDHLVGSVEVDEGHGDPTVLGLLARRDEHIPQTHGDAADQIDVLGHRLEWHERVVRDGGGPSEQEARALGGTDYGWTERGCGGGAQHYFAGIRGRFHGHNGAGPRTGNDELTVRLTHEKEVEESAVDTHRHPQGDPLTQDGHAPDHSKCAPHLDGGARGPRLMGLARKDEQKRVAPELEYPASVSNSNVD